VSRVPAARDVPRRSTVADIAFDLAIVHMDDGLLWFDMGDRRGGEVGAARRAAR